MEIVVIVYSDNENTQLVESHASLAEVHVEQIESEDRGRGLVIRGQTTPESLMKIVELLNPRQPAAP